MKLLSRVLFLSLESKAFSLMFESLFPVMLIWFNITANCQLCPFWMTAPCKCLNLYKYHFTIYNILSSLSGSKVKKKREPHPKPNRMHPHPKKSDISKFQSWQFGRFLYRKIFVLWALSSSSSGRYNRIQQCSLPAPNNTFSYEKQCDTPCAFQRIAAPESLFHSPKE